MIAFWLILAMSFANGAGAQALWTYAPPPLRRVEQ